MADKKSSHHVGQPHKVEHDSNRDNPMNHWSEELESPHSLSSANWNDLYNRKLAGHSKVSGTQRLSMSEERTRSYQ
ncbi:hypothetical protein [Thalassobacillus sp. CUG 92003]|uniref:hypothetical protein n=1 Tax=Thalassobacillus sp. CUG 92003 TaxID=2736641 RepID=UPI0015E791A5|nr:hypothetical protein [Thalassobacillus sp. CUG 92003]